MAISNRRSRNQEQPSLPCIISSAPHESAARHQKPVLRIWLVKHARHLVASITCVSSHRYLTTSTEHHENQYGAREIGPGLIKRIYWMYTWEIGGTVHISQSDESLSSSWPNSSRKKATSAPAHSLCLTRRDRQCDKLRYWCQTCRPHWLLLAAAVIDRVSKSQIFVTSFTDVAT